MIRIFLILVLLFFYHSAISQVHPAPIFTSHMVLQQNSKVSIWGKGAKNSPIKIVPGWNKKTFTCISDENGIWKTKVQTPESGGPYTLKLICGDTVTLKDILIGEVWFAAGQSNLEMKLKNVKNADTEVAGADFPRIRLFRVPRAIAYEESDTFSIKNEWQVCQPGSTADFSAIAYFFARKLHKNIEIPVGIICASWGGSPIESWMSKQVLISEPGFPEIFTRWDIWRDQYKQDSVNYTSSIIKWQDDSLAGLINKKPQTPQSLYMVQRPYRQPSVLYNGMVAPIIPYTIKGFIWYQGTSNKTWFEEYTLLFRTLIKSWRKSWNLGNLPFYYVQNPPFNFEFPEEGAGLREAQLNGLLEKNTGIVITMDLGDKNNLHPTNKAPVGERLADWALVKTYGKGNLVVSGPLFKKFRIEKSSIRIYFNHTGSGLLATDGELRNFQIAGKDRKFFPAQVKIDGNTLLVTSEQVKNPVAVRYAFGNVFDANFFNREGLPASPFRTDDWKLR